MAKSRKDSRGYVLRTGESQRKDGRYSYSYTDLNRKRRTVYAKTLVELRTKERKIIRDKEDGLDPMLADRITLNHLYDKYSEQKYDLKPSTKVNYIYMYNRFVRPTFGKRFIGKIRYSDIKRFYYGMILDEEMKPNTLEIIHTQLHPAFQMAVRDEFVYRPDEKGKSAKHISIPKTISGRRTIPIIDEVFNAFLDEYELQKCVGFSSEEIDGYSNFVFVTATGSIYLPSAVNRAIERARVAYNKEEIDKAEKEDREPLIIPHFSAYNLRHTFCTRFCENESNLKIIQSIMGHTDISTTMDVYAEATQEKKQEIVANLQGKIII